MQLMQLNIKLQESNKSLFVQNVREERRATEKQRERAQTELAHYGDTADCTRSGHVLFQMQSHT